MRDELFIEDFDLFKRVLMKHDPEVVSQVKNILFYEEENSLGTMYSVCLLIGEGRSILARGISICSFSDTFSKLDGYYRAAGRAVKALKHMKSSDEIKIPSDYNCDLVERTIVDSMNKIFVVFVPYRLPVIFASLFFKYKSTFMPIVTDYEATMLVKLYSYKYNIVRG